MKIFSRKKQKRKEPRSISQIILISFTAVSFLIVGIMGVSLSNMFTSRIRSTYIDNTESVSRQEVLNIEEYLSNMRNIANAIYYDVIKETDLSSHTLSDQFSLLYAANSDELVSISLFDENGSLICASPGLTLKPGVDPREQEWYTSAMETIENMHFSQPHVQNLFTSASYSYNWVISLSVAVNMTSNGHPVQGVLLIDMNYRNLEEHLSAANSQMTDTYSYLISDTGELIYHPKLSRILAGYTSENTTPELSYPDGDHAETFNGEERIVITNTISYSGWKLVSVIPNSTLTFISDYIRNLTIMVISLTLAVIFLVNRLIANRISSPLIALTDAIANSEGAINPDLYQNSSREVMELGETLHNYLDQIDRLLNDIVYEQEEKRKSALDALQAQINPHFLYNTLDSIVWMIEDERNEEAVFMITQLAAFFRMSLNRGKSMISIENELKQAQAYLNIQKVRYRQSFTDYYDIEEGCEKYITVKLVIQPILENAIYHGIKEAEQDGEIRIRVWKEQNDICISVSDNGYGMTPEEVETLLVESKKPAVEKHGSGVGLINVDKRLRLRFGDEYGLKVESEPDEGTTVIIRLPAIEATPENLNLFEGE